MKTNLSKKSKCSDRLRQKSHCSKARWLSYAAATGAAAVAGSGEAQAVTLQFPGPGSVGANGSIALDLNGDTVDDITIFNLNSTSFYSNGGGRAAASGSVLGAYGGYFSTGKSYLYARKFSNFSSITPTFSPPGNPGYYSYGIANGTQHYMRDGGGFPLSGWGADPGPGLLGVRFDIGGNSHMGFVEISIDGSNNGSGNPGNVPSIISYGYETQPNTALSVPIPEPSSLGLLAMGASGLVGLRRRRPQ